MIDAAPIAVVVARHEGRVLIGRRPAGAPLAGFWEFPGGKVRPGETPEQAAVRECREETGLDVRLVGSAREVFFEYEHGRVRLHFFAAVPLDPARPPAAPFVWVPVAELGGYAFPPANAQIVDALVRGCWTGGAL